MTIIWCDHMLYCSWDMMRNRCNCYFSLWAIFCHFTKNHDHMLYCSWDMMHNRCNCYFSPWAIFCHFTSLAAQENKMKKKKKKKCLEISSFYISIPKITIICYTVPEILRMTYVIFFILGYFLPFYPPNRPKNQNFKIWKKYDI